MQSPTMAASLHEYPPNDLRHAVAATIDEDLLSVPLIGRGAEASCRRC